MVFSSEGPFTDGRVHFLMQDAATVLTHVTHYVKFARKVNDGNYGTTEAEILIAVPAPVDLGGEELIDKLQKQFAVGEALVFEQLQRDYTLNEQGVIVEILPAAQTPPDAVSLIRDTFGGGEVLSPEAVVELEAAAGNVVRADFGRTNGGDYDPEFVKGLPKAEQKKWLLERWNTHPQEFWDNRNNKRSEKSPDIKHKQLNLAAWL